MNLPTILTIFRIFLVPILVVVLLAPPSRLADSPLLGTASPAPREILGVAIFLLATLTDILDGWLARRRGQVTVIGTLLDPLADKLLTSAAFISLVAMGLAPAWMVVIIVGREFVVSGLRSVLLTRGIVLPASPWGKLKTASQVVAIVLLILTKTLERWGRYGALGVAALWVSMLLALGSAVHYVWRALRFAPDLLEDPAGGGEGGGR